MFPCSCLRKAGTNGRPWWWSKLLVGIATAGGLGTGLDILRWAVILGRLGGLFFFRGQIWAVILGRLGGLFFSWADMGCCFFRGQIWSVILGRLGGLFFSWADMGCDTW
jgi:hypothetical protein